MIFGDKPQINMQFRFGMSLGVLTAFFFVITLRLWYLQIINGEYFREQSENNRLQTVYLPPPRGLITDRNGIVLARNRPAFHIEFVPEDCPDVSGTMLRLSSLLGMPNDELTHLLKDQKRRRKFEPRLLLKDVSRDIVALVAAHRFELPGVIISVVPTRDYIYGSLASHVLGYIREITKEQLDSAQFASYRMNDLVGQFGIESRWEPYLQGKRGLRQVVVNAVGTRIREASTMREVAGHNLTLSIDFKVQQAADEALMGKKGAIVALDPNTGEILALSSAPAFDPNIFTGELTAQQWKEFTTGTQRILSNRALQGAYPPGSVFKIWMLIAGLSEAVVTPKDGVTCGGFYHFSGRNYHCHKRAGHGWVDLFGALVQSCDIYFYQLGRQLGIDRINDYMTRFGFARSSGLELVDEAEGIIPSTLWKKTHFKKQEDQKWYPGETLSVAIGQGATTVTPLQITRATAALVNGGKLMKPSLVKRIESTSGTFKDEDFSPQVESLVDVDPKHLEIVKDAMVGVVNDARGTGRRANLEKELNIKVGGKTGTAQVVSLDYHKKGGEFDHHAWFVGYAPAEDPKIVVTALIEHGGGGGANAAPLVKKVMEAYFGYDPDASSDASTGADSTANTDVEEVPVEVPNAGAIPQ